MSSRFYMLARAAILVAAIVVLPAHAFAQMSDDDNGSRSGSSVWRTRSASSPGKTRNCSTATGSSKSRSGNCRRGGRPPSPARPMSAANPPVQPQTDLSTHRPSSSRIRSRPISSPAADPAACGAVGRQAVVATMPSIPTRIRTHRVCRAHSAAASCRSIPMPSPTLRPPPSRRAGADAGRANRSTSPTPLRAEGPRRADDHLALRARRRKTSSTSASATSSARIMRWRKRPCAISSEVSE